MKKVLRADIKHVGQTMKRVLLFCIMIFTVWTARADYVGELETSKYFDPATIDLIKSRIAAGQPLQPGDVVSYFIQFTPTNNGGFVGGGGFVTDYIPANTQVVGAEFVRLDNSPQGYSVIEPPGPAAVLPAYVPLYSDTGIFYSTDPRTAIYTNPASPIITATNGYPISAKTGCKTFSLPSSTHNDWDNQMMIKFAAATRNNTGTCAAPPVINYNVLGLSPVAGPDTFLPQDYVGPASVGPWQRIAYPGSYKGTLTGTASYGMTNACIGGVPTAAGWNLSPSNPLPPNTNAVRFAAGKVTVGELFTVRISLRLNAAMSPGGLINNTEVFGGDASLDPGSTAGKDNHWKYHCPAVAVSNSSLMLVKTLTGACTGVGCTPTPVTAGVVPAAANLKLRYTVEYLNLGGTPQTNVVLKDTLATGGAYVPASYVALSGVTPTGAPTVAAGVMTFPTIASLPAGQGGKLQYDINFATAPGPNAALINTANMTSTEVPTPGVSSKAIASATNTANLWIGKSVTPSSSQAGGTVSYTITVPNNGGANATSVVVRDWLPTAGISTLAQDRFSYVAGSVVAQIINAAGVVTAVTPTVTVTPPATPAARELVTFTLPAATAIPMGGRLQLTFNALVGGNVPASSTAYGNNAEVQYAGGFTATSLSQTSGAAPVTVTAPLQLALKVDCVYSGATCVPYANGSIAPNSKIRYRADYKNLSASTHTNVVLTDTLPANVTYVTGSAQRDGAPLADPTIAGAVLTFAPTTLTGGQSGYLTFEAQLGAGVTTGMDITNTAKLTSATFTSGVTASVTTSVRDQANLVISKSVSPATVNPGGSVTYTVTVANIGNAPANNIVLYDLLPYSGATADAAMRFNYGAANSFTLNNASGTSTIASVTPSTSVPPTFTGYTGQANRQEIKWTFPAAQVLGQGDSFTLTYTATVGSNVPVVATPYYSDVQASYVSNTVPPSSTLYSGAQNVAPVTVGGLDHLLILHSGSALTCEPEAVTVQACGDAACGTFYTGTVNATLTGGGAISFSGGTTSASVAQTTAGILTLGASGITPTPLAATPVRCSQGATDTCSLSFADAALILTDAGTPGTEITVADQVAGVPSATYKLRAVKTDKATGACVAAVSGARQVAFAYECNDPDTCASGNLLTVNGAEAQANKNGGGMFGYSYGASSVTLNFDASGISTDTLAFAYEDVGQITLRFRTTAGSGAKLEGNSNAFHVTPHHLVVDVCDAATVEEDCPEGTAAVPTDGSGAILARAGTDKNSQSDVVAFKATVRSMSANNKVTPSFGVAGPTIIRDSESVTLAHTCLAPLVAGVCPNAGSLAGTTSFSRSAFNQGKVTTADLAWSEVGVLRLDATLSSFMGKSGASGQSAAAGRFAPHHFDTTVTAPMTCPNPPFASCPAGGMAYSGQPFTVNVMARNAADGTTSNYTGAFAKTVTLSAVDKAGGSGTPAGTLTAGTLGAFTGSADTGNSTSFAFTTTPTAPTDVFIRASDGETNSQTAGHEGGLKLVSGRIRFANAVGSNLANLPVTAYFQYWDGTRWQTNRNDTVSYAGVTGGGLTQPTIVTTSGTLTGRPVVSSSDISGGYQFKLQSPGGGNAGKISLVVDPAKVPAWMQDTSGAGTATFGVHTGAANGTRDFIYLREAY